MKKSNSASFRNFRALKPSAISPVVISTDLIERRILLIRGQKVMLDRDLAQIYQVKPIRLREQVKRNISRFPNDFMFQLTEGEAQSMVSQNAIPSRKHLGGSLPYVFTEHGVAMLSSVLNSESAVQINIFIMRAFVKLREALATNKHLARKIEDIERQQKEQGERLEIVCKVVRQLMESPKKPNRTIGFRAAV
jgi:hypothetical protein